ncbi:MULTISPECIES: hypothetical protein [Sorangium]|uniref:hypothetical protein n=1 Tax=Sorangium sp. So ce836 TaxID=2969250 RepID=UPI0013ECEF33|nr:MULTISPECIES: hypothetical protein [Sorangium]
MDADRHRFAADGAAGHVTDVTVPERAGALGLPAQPPLRLALGALRAAAKSVRRVQAPYGGLGDRARFEPPLVDERLEDERHRGVGMLAPDVEQQRAQLLRELLREAL